MSSDNQHARNHQERGGSDRTSGASAPGQDGRDKNPTSSLTTQSWYWPHSTREEAERRLAGQPDGSFLIRDCSVAGDFTLTVRKDGCNKCIRIYRHQNGYSLSPSVPDTPFCTLPELVEFYRSHSLAAFNKSLDVCLSHAVGKPAVVGSNQYNVFKELYNLSQEQLSAHTRLSVLQQQQSVLDQNIKMFDVMLPAVRVVQQMYYNSMKLQQKEWDTPQSTDTAAQEHGADSEKQTGSDQCIQYHGSDNPSCEGRLSIQEEKSLTANTALLFSRHSALSEKLHGLRSRYDADLVKLRELDAELKNVEHRLIGMERRQAELIRLMVEMGCQKEYLNQVLESRVATKEFDRSTWLIDCNRDEALAYLEGLPHGTFLIRRKDKRHLPYVLSIVLSGDSGPRTVQHCYIVRPHGRGYGFNPALAVFESIDQLVLRHRYVSLKHYFKHLDVMLTFPVGCQELLRQSMSESDKESLRVKEGEYANATAIQAASEETPQSAGGAETVEGSCSIVDSQKSEEETVSECSKHHLKNVDSRDSTSFRKTVTENVYEPIEFEEESCKKTGFSEVNTQDVFKEHVYEAVEYSDSNVDSGSITGNAKKSVYENEPTNSSENSAISSEHCKIQKAAKTHTYEPVASPETVKSTSISSSRFRMRVFSQEDAREHTYEDI